MRKGNRGQLSIFLGITLVLVMSMLAFVVNVGLFVKAKINLQNAVDAAAFSGASTQARQLTNIAYANWELRNTYKEWMFKYYVLGQIGLFNTNFANLAGPNPDIDFSLKVPPALNFNAGTATNSVPIDAYNIPSICIHNNTSKNICPLYMVPGLPRFKAIGVAGITEIHEAIVDKLVKEKASDCSDRTTINYLAAMSWTYGSGIKDIPGAPVIAANRPGAWLQAIEIAMRIRNLEMILNRPPVSGGIDSTNALQLASVGSDIALNERPYKAFMSAYKNLGGGKYKDNPKGVKLQDELVANFKLYEVPPTPYHAQANSASGFLIPSDFSYIGSGGTSSSALEKHYVDLQVMPVNYALMYSAFTTTSYKYEGVDAAASCGISKTAIPVPGYILGFVKNPAVLTYYAVRGESKFIGLFYPFADQNGIKLTAYGAAKPFGGRIGPRLFTFTENDKGLTARDDALKRSKPYISGLKAPPSGLAFKTGYPIPYDQDFWATCDGGNGCTLGGIPGAGTQTKFGIPNLIYDFENEGDLSKQTASMGVIQNVAFDYPQVGANHLALGLYNRVQFRSLRNSLGVVAPGGLITSDQVTDALIRSRRPTKYDAINYLIPDKMPLKGSGNNSLPYIGRSSPSNVVGSKSIRYRLFAPLISQSGSTLYKNQTDVLRIITDYVDTAKPSVTTYLQSLFKVATSIANTPSTSGNNNDYTDAARTIHMNANRPATDWRVQPLNDASCATDIASKFNHFFNGNAEACGIEPISSIMVKFITKSADPSDDQANLYYHADYTPPGTNTNDTIQDPIDLMTAYFPGKRQGSDGTAEGLVAHPLGISNSDSYSSRRNYYSTKFVQLAKLVKNPPGTAGSTFGIADYAVNSTLAESNTTPVTDPGAKVSEILNPIEYDATTGINNSYFLDF